MTESLHAVEAVILLLMALVAGFAVVAGRLQVPYPIVLVVAGLGISFVPRIPRVPLNPDLVFLIFLPPLLYSSAWVTSWREFRRNALPIGLLAFGAVVITVVGVAEVSDRFITALDWKAGFLLGAVVSTTDAIAASAIAKTLGLPRRIVDILEGESLLNDAAGLLALEIGVRLLLQGDAPTVAGGAVRLVYLAGGGIAIGLLIGVIVRWVERFIDDGPIELVVSLIVPYAAYLAAEGAGASGVLAVVACGLYLSRKSPEMFSAEVRLQVFGAWTALTFALNGLVFVLIGLQLPYVLAGIRGRYGMWTLLLYGVVFSVVLIALRMAWVFPAIGAANVVERRWMKRAETKLPWRGTFVIGWTGMRGVLALAAAISLPELLGNGQPFGPRNLIVFLTFSVILVTLVLQGLTLPVLIRALGLAGSEGVEREETDARRLALEAAMEHLEQERKADGAEYQHVYDDLGHRYEHRLAALGEGGAGGSDEAIYRRMRAAALGALQAERTTLVDLRNQGRIGDETLRALEREFDLSESRARGTKR